MTATIASMLMNMMEMVIPREAEAEAEGCPKPRQVTHLLWRVAHGDRSALAALYDQTSSLAYGLALRITGDRAAAEEITAAVYEQAWHSAASIAASACFLTWLAESTRVLALERRQPVLERQPLPAAVVVAKTPAPAEPEAAATLPQEWEAHRPRAGAALARLAPEERAVVELAYFSGLKVSDIARQLQLPAERVRSLLRSGMLTFRCALSQHPSTRQQ